MRRLIYLLPLLLFAVLAGWFALSLRPDYDPHAVPSALLNKEAPEFALAGLKGDRVPGDGLSRATIKGKPAVINFFASWCVPCRVEHPLLMRLSSKAGVALFGIDYKDKTADAERLLSALGDPYRAIGVDTDGRIGLDFGITGVPETFVIDPMGRIRMRFVGPLTEDQIEHELLPLLKSFGAS